jgi:cellulose synthase/poly-beta-1,6-N-acetylglucosamine synthase-like glycosyltransferase
MQIALWVWTLFIGLSLIVWLSRLAQLLRAARDMPPLTAEMYAEWSEPLPTVSFLVAAKEEAANIEACLQSLVAQDYPGLQIIAINDRSNDDTGGIIDRVASATGRVTPVHVQTLLPGWLGKNNAMRTGVERATGQWLCFTDADCIHNCPRALRIAMIHALVQRVDFISVLPSHEARGFWERVIQPACSGIMMIWFNPMKVNDPRKKTAYANGAFMLMRRSCYDAIGGHDAVKAAFNEDMHMARLAKEKGQRLLVVSNEKLYTVRMYESLAQIWAGWSRIFFGCFGTLRRLLLSIVAVLVFTFLPWASLAALGVLSIVHPASATAVRIGLAIAACATQAFVMMRFYGLNHSRPLYGLLYPLGAAVGLGALFNAIRRLRGRAKITWRGTTYGGAKLDTVQS